MYRLFNERKRKKTVLLPIFFFLTIFIAYIFTRFYQAAPFILPYLKQTMQFITQPNKISYDQKMFAEKGTRYLYPKKIEEVTEANSTICFWDDDIIVDAPIASYFLYPRYVKTISSKSEKLLSDIRSKGCNYIFISEKTPETYFTCKGIYIFGNSLEDDTLYTKKSYYIHNSNLSNISLLQL